VLEVRSFAADDVEAAAALLAERHERHRAAEPLLALAGDVDGLVRRAWEKERASGTVAIDGGEVIGYLLGSVNESRWWGRHVWIGLAGHAAREPEVIRDLYRLAAERWVAEDALLHLAFVPAVPEMTEPWLRLAFAYMQAHGIRETGAGPRPLPPGLVVRQGSFDDLRAAPELTTQIWQHHASAPTFTGLAVPSVEAFLDDWEAVLQEPDVGYFVAEIDEQLVGHLVMEPEEHDLARPPGSVYLSVAATLPEARGRGVGVALTERALEWAFETGYVTAQTDWRVANLESSRFWPRRGFRETFFRMARRVRIG